MFGHLIISLHWFDIQEGGSMEQYLLSSIWPMLLSLPIKSIALFSFSTSSPTVMWIFFPVKQEFSRIMHRFWLSVFPRICYASWSFQLLTMLLGYQHMVAIGFQCSLYLILWQYHNHEYGFLGMIKMSSDWPKNNNNNCTHIPVS